MSSTLLGGAPRRKLPKVDDAVIAIVRTEWNSQITDALAADAAELFKQQKFSDAQVQHFIVPGAVELTFAASQLIEASMFDAIIVIGCVIKGDTPHFDYVCQSVTQGITALNADVDTPVIFGVLTVNTLEQAQERVEMGKGREFAETAIKMIHFKETVNNL